MKWRVIYDDLTAERARAFVAEAEAAKQAAERAALQLALAQAKAPKVSYHLFCQECGKDWWDTTPQFLSVICDECKQWQPPSTVTDCMEWLYENVTGWPESRAALPLLQAACCRIHEQAQGGAAQ
jgi:hypothetical protein